MTEAALRIVSGEQIQTAKIDFPVIMTSQSEHMIILFIETSFYKTSSKGSKIIQILKYLNPIITIITNIYKTIFINTHSTWFIKVTYFTTLLSK